MTELNIEISHIIKQYQEQVEEIKQLKEKLDDALGQIGFMAKQENNLKQKLEKIKELIQKVKKDPKGHPVNAWFIFALQQRLDSQEK